MPNPPPEPFWHSWVQPVVGALIALVTGVLVMLGTARFTSRRDKTQRRHALLREQVDRFYSPMMGWSALIRARSLTRVKVQGEADAEWQEQVARRMDPQQQHAFEALMGPEFDKLVDDDNRRLKEELLPLYRQMRDCFTTNLWLAEPSTREHYAALVEFVDVWDRFLSGTLPKGVVRRLNQQEPTALHEELERQLDRIRKELEEG
jgi:hypothetical protein